MQTQMYTLSGVYLDFANLNVDQITIANIAKSLSFAPRFAGQTYKLWSVAQHSYCVSLILGDENRELALAGLLHDATEAFMCDIPTPLKVLLPQYREIQEKLESLFAARYGYQYPHAEEVKLADFRMMNLESSFLGMPWGDLSWWKSDEGEYTLENLIGRNMYVFTQPLPSSEAENLFLDRFYHLWWRI